MLSIKNINKFGEKKNKKIKELEEVAIKRTKVSAENRLSCEIDWLEVPIIQTPEDMMRMQELIFKIQSDIIIEFGIAHEGSLKNIIFITQIIAWGE